MVGQCASSRTLIRGFFLISMLQLHCLERSQRHVEELRAACLPHLGRRLREGRQTKSLAGGVIASRRRCRRRRPHRGASAGRDAPWPLQGRWGRSERPRLRQRRINASRQSTASTVSTCAITATFPEPICAMQSLRLCSVVTCGRTSASGLADKAAPMATGSKSVRTDHRDQAPVFERPPPSWRTAPCRALCPHNR
jgi:hypothetical protein